MMTPTSTSVPPRLVMWSGRRMKPFMLRKKKKLVTVTRRNGLSARMNGTDDYRMATTDSVPRRSLADLAGDLVLTLDPAFQGLPDAAPGGSVLAAFVALGGPAMGGGAVVFGLAPSFDVAFAGRLCVGLGASVMLIAWLALASAWFRPDEFATISGFTQTVGNVGAFAAASPLVLLVEAVGWRPTFVMIGGATLALAVVAAAFIRDRPEALGLPPLNPERIGAASPALRDVLRGVSAVVANRRSWPPILAAGGVYTT